jgi:hypothetical protein
MQAHVTGSALTPTAVSPHLWRRQRHLEDSLETVVYVRCCTECGQLEAKAGHKDPEDSQGWELIEAGTLHVEAA